MTSDKFVVGRSLWWVPQSAQAAKDARYVTITKIGRKWIYIHQNYRIDAATLRADGAGSSSPGTCWLTKEAWEEHVLTNRLINQLRDKLYWGKAASTVQPDHVRQAAVLLGVVLE